VPRPEYATHVEASTTGLITGEASMNAMPAAGCTPRRISRRATGTEPHSHTGNARPPSAAHGTWTPTGSRATRAKSRSGT
jgi:hypothetical protein